MSHTTPPINDPRLAETADALGDQTKAGRARHRPWRRTAAVPITADLLEGAPVFDPAPRKATRYDGWTYPRQRAFVKLLAETGCVRRACARLGMSTVGAYQLRRQPGAEGFAAAWADAQAVGVATIADLAFERAIHGTPRGVYWRGEKVGEERRYNDRLLMFTLRHHAPETYGARTCYNLAPHQRTKPADPYADPGWERYKAEHGGRTPVENLARTLDIMAERLRVCESEEERAEREAEEDEALPG